MRSLRTTAAAAVCLLSLSAGGDISAIRAKAKPLQSQTRSAPPARKEATVPFRVGEVLTYDVSWSSFLTAGTASMTVRQKQPSQNAAAYAVTAEGHPLPALTRLFSLSYRMDSLIDTSTLLSQQSTLTAEEGDRKASSTTRFDRRARKAFFERAGDEASRRTFDITAQTQDGLAMLYALRALSLSAGGRIEVPIANDGELFTASVNAAGPERVRVPLRTFDTMNLKLTILDERRQPFGKDIAVWISTDPQRLPVKLQADLPVGSFTLALRDAR